MVLDTHAIRYHRPRFQPYYQILLSKLQQSGVVRLKSVKYGRSDYGVRLWCSNSKQVIPWHRRGMDVVVIIENLSLAVSA